MRHLHSSLLQETLRHRFERERTTPEKLGAEMYLDMGYRGPQNCIERIKRFSQGQLYGTSSDTPQLLDNAARDLSLLLFRVGVQKYSRLVSQMQDIYQQRGVNFIYPPTQNMYRILKVRPKAKDVSTCITSDVLLLI